MTMQLRNAGRWTKEEQMLIFREAERVRLELGG
jgi:hypothetical protein